ncbi:MAG: hypothetical protein ACK41T_06570 [Pseudobdellovibrio sp.]
MSFTNKSDDELKKFLQKNQPLPKKNDFSQEELNELVSRLKLKKDTSYPVIWGTSFAVSLAAAFLIYNLVNQNLNSAQPTRHQQIAKIEASDEFLQEEDEYPNNNLPTLNIGDEYLTLSAVY